MPFESISNRRLYRQIANQIISLIEAGEYKPGERLPAERILAERLAVSRPTVREALLALEVENRVEIRGGSGVFVLERPEPPVVAATPTAGGHNSDPFELLFARTLIEPDIAALAANNASPKHLAALAKALGNMVCCSAGDSRRVDYDREFHLALAEASGNTPLLLAMRALWASCEQADRPFQEDLDHSEQAWRCSIIEHREILEAVKKADATAASLSMRRHLNATCSRLTSDRREAGGPVLTVTALARSRPPAGHFGAYPAMAGPDAWPMRSARTG